MHGYLNLQKAAEMYPDRKKAYDLKFKVQFGPGQSNIQLDIPRGGKETTEGWNIKPSYHPRVSIRMKFAFMLMLVERWWIPYNIDYQGRGGQLSVINIS